jgi:hypothetical protein
MTYEELQARYGSYLAEMVRQVLTLEEFQKLEVETVLPYLELRTERMFQEYRQCTSAPSDKAQAREDYALILERRWHEADDLTQQVAAAEKQAREADYIAAVGA